MKSRPVSSLLSNYVQLPLYILYGEKIDILKNCLSQAGPHTGLKLLPKKGVSSGMIIKRLLRTPFPKERKSLSMGLDKDIRKQRLSIAGLIGLTVLSLCHMGLNGPTKGTKNPLPEGVSQWTVAQDGTGQFFSIQEAIDQADSGNTIWIKAGTYAEDVTVHSKDGLTIIGEGMDQVILSGLKRVGTLHIGKWPYGATNVEIHGLTVVQHGGLGVGIFNGSGVLLKSIKVQGMVFGQQVHNVRLEDCMIGGSETTGVSFADSKATLIGNFIHDNDHGVAVGGTSQVFLKQNIITRSLFEAVMVTDEGKARLIRNTLVRNGGGVAFHDRSQGEVSWQYHRRK